MCGGGGGGGGQDPTYQQNIENDRRNAEQNRARELQNANTAETVATRDRYNAAMAGVNDYGLGVANAYLGERGITNSDAGTVTNVLNNIRNSIPDLDPNPNKYFTREAVGRELDTVAQGTRDKLTNQLGSSLAPGFERSLVPDTADDAILQSILGEQRGNAQKILDFNKARGVLNDTGYSTALNELEGQGKAGYNTLSGIGESVIGKSRQALSDIRGEAGQAASGYNYGASIPDIGSYVSRAQTKAQQDIGNLEGSIRGAVGTTNVFDAPLALQKGGTLQGPIDLTTRAAGPVMASNERKDKGRGLGSTGVF